MKKDISTSYSWPVGSSITRVDVRAQKNGQSVAYLYADPASPKEKLQEIRAALRLKGWGTLSDSRDGAFVLRVAGIRDGSQLLSMLHDGGFVSAASQQSDIVEAGTVPTTLNQKIRANSLSYSGILATVGNVLSIASGIHRGKLAKHTDWGQIGKGLAFGVADLPLAIAGESDDSRQLGDFLRKLKSSYEKNGIEVPRTASIYVETSNRNKGFSELANDYMHRYANQIKCGMEVVAAGFSIKAGATQKLWPKRYAPFLWGSGFLASLLIPERKIDPEKYTDAGTLERGWMKLQSNPLAVGGILGYTNTIADYYSSHIGKQQWQAAGKQGPRMYLWDAATPTVMIGANGLYAISKKTVGGDIKNEGMVQDAYRIASQIINKQPPELREKAIETTARFFGQRMEIKETYQDARVRLVKELDSQRQNPWFENVTLPPRTPKKSRHDAVLQDMAAAPTSAPASLVQASGIEHQSKGIAAANDGQFLATANGR